MARSYDARSPKPLGQVELAEEPVHGVREGAPVGRDPDGGNRRHARPVGRGDLPPEIGSTRGDVDAVDPDWQAEPAPDEERAAVGAPEKDLVPALDAGN